MRVRWLVAALLMIAAAERAAAQEIRGAVHDSASGHRLAGVVVLLLDESGSTVARGLTSGLGTYRVPRPAGATRLQLRRIGFRPRTLPLGAGDQLDVAMVPLPTLLEPVRVTDEARCSKRRDREAALGLWEQARSALLATVVAREVTPDGLVRLRYDRSLDGERIVKQRVVVDSSERTTRPFAAARSGEEFVRQGFLHVASVGGPATFYGPDADVLLDDAFARGYCFHLAPSDRGRPREVGLGFVPGRAAARGGVQIEGTLWVDTAARTLREVAFRYVGDRAVEAGRAGGRVEFRALDNGLVVIDRWGLRLPDPRGDTTWAADGKPTTRTLWTTREIGGEMARAAWPDGFAWQGALGTLRVRALTREGRPAAGTALRLRETGYEGTADTSGALVIPYLLPGPYTLDIVEPTLERLGIILPTPVRFVAERDSVVHATIEVPTLEDYVTTQCLAARHIEDPVGEGSAWLLARVTATDGSSVAGMKWRISRAATAVLGETTVISGTLGPDGTLAWCKNLPPGAPIALRVWRDEKHPLVTEIPLDEQITAVRIRFDPRGGGGQ